MPAVGQDTRPVNVKAHTRKAPTPKPKKVKVKVSQAPVRTPDSRDNNAAARAPKPPANPSPDARDVTDRSRKVPVFSVPGATSRTATITLRQHDQQVAADTQAQARAKVAARRAPKVKTGHGPGHLLASINPAAYVGALKHADFDGMGVVSGAVKVAGRAAKDAEEMAVTLPSSVAHVVVTAATHPKKLPGELAKPYVELAKHPVKTLSEHPLQTALMVAPAVRMPGRAVGKVARVTGKQTLERPPAVLPNTALKEPHPGSRDVVARAVQSAKDRRNPARKVTVRQVQRRVDEAYGAQQKHKERVTAAVMRDAKAEAQGMPKAQRDEHIVEARVIARSAAKDQAHRAYVREFGAIHQVTPQGHVVAPKGAVEGTLHDTAEQAQKVADRLNRAPMKLKMGGFTRGEKTLPLARQHRDVTFVTHKAGEKHGVIPDFVAKRISKQEGVGTGRAPGAKILRVSRGAFTRTVLPYRPTWLTGQSVEGVIRNAVHGAGPTSYLRARKVVAAMERQNPGSGKALLERAVPGGKIGKVYKEFGDVEGSHPSHTLAHEFPDNPVAHALTGLGKAPGIKQVRQLHHAVTNAVFTHINGKFLEGVPQTAMLGKALKNSPLMERSIIGLSDKAIDDAARGLQGTHAQVELARAIQRAYGKYSNFGPGLREAITHWSPFLPWAVNSGRFLLSVLPKDHPVTTALLADINAAEEDWRKAHNLSLRQPNHVPFFMLGGYPKADGSMLQVGHYTPSGAAQDPTGGLAGMVLPQFSGAYGALQYGVDWKGKPLMHGGPHGTPYTAAEKWLYALTQLGEAMAPLSQQVSDVAGSSDKAATLRKEFRLMASTPGQQASTTSGPSVSVKPLKVKPLKVKPIHVKPLKVR
jgi:hypothetical protein